MVAQPERAGGPLLSLEDFARLPEEDAFRVELSRGRLVREPRPGAEHGWLTGRLVLLLGSYAREHHLGLVVTETGFILGEHPSTVRGPDAAFIAAGRLPPEGIPIGFWPMAPNLAVEVVSPSDTAAEIQEKVLEYLEAGTELVWVVQASSRSVTVWHPSREARVFGEGEVLDAGDVLPGFELEVAEIFRR
ncbi:MAG: Uma2 family endonuclease [Gemmatimonadota bacterium]